MIVRRAKMSDANGILDLYRELSGDVAIADAAAVAKVIDHAGTSIWSAHLDQDVVGMVTLHILPNVTHSGRPYALIENVVTRRDHQRAGVGRALMEAAMQDAWSHNTYKIMLMTGKTANAKGFYESLGFAADEKWGMSIRTTPIRL